MPHQLVFAAFNSAREISVQGKTAISLVRLSTNWTTVELAVGVLENIFVSRKVHSWLTAAHAVPSPSKEISAVQHKK